MKYKATTAYIICRVSDESQEEAGNSLEAQKYRAEKYCERNSLEVLDTHMFQESAYKQVRKEFDSILAIAKKETEKRVIALIFDKVDRLSRGAYFDKRIGELFEMAVQGKIELHFASDNQVIHNQMNAGENFQFMIALGLAKYYSDAISDNVKRAFEKMRRDGVWIGKPRVGYMNVTDKETKKKDIVIDPVRAHLITFLFKNFATGQYSVQTMQDEMKRRGLTSREGNVLSRSNIHYILRDPFYYGIAESKKHGRYPHKYQCLITKETFIECQNVLDNRRKTKIKRDVKQDYLFGGLLTCQHCGCAMSAEIKKNKYVYYSCTNAKGICKRKYIPEKTLLEPVYEIFEAFASVPQEVHQVIVEELRKTHEGEKIFHQRELNRLRNEYDRLQVRIDKILDLLLDESITQAIYDKKLSTLKSQQSKVQLELEEHGKGDHEFHITVARVLKLSRGIKDIFDSSETKDKRAILDYLLQNPTVKGEKIQFELKKPYDTILNLALETEKATQGDSSVTYRPVGLRGQDSNLRPIG
jgi:site-specific DNA recombinase